MEGIPGLSPAVDFLGCRLNPLSVQDFVETVTEYAAQRQRLRITYLNAHTSNLAARDQAHRDAVNGCDIVYADGQAIVWAGRTLGHRIPERVNAGDFILDFCRACARRDLRVFLLGCAEGIAQRASDAWKVACPGLQIVGTRNGYFVPHEAETVAREIGESRPDIILVGMSSPTQERWMQQWGDTAGAPVIWCVGALFEYYSHTRARAPVWVRRAGLEWLFRLVLEPRRLWRRYLIGNVAFVLRVLRELARRR